MQNKQDFDIIVIGAGIAGLLTVRKLAKLKINGEPARIALIEAGSDVLPIISTSQNGCNKLHTGMHYLNAENSDTAKHCLINAIEFAKEYKDFIAGGENSENPCRGRHYILDKSIVSPQEAEKIAEELRQLYREKIGDSSNKVFGEPENFIKKLEEEEYDFFSKTIPVYDSSGKETTASIAIGYQTAEAQLDINKLQEYLRTEITKTPNIKFIPNTFVTNIDLTPDRFGYYVVANQKNTQVELSSRCVINCAWQNAQWLDRGIDPYSANNTKTDTPGVNRVKVSVDVKLPPKYENINTSLFSVGPYFSITNLENGMARLTSERITNIAHYPTGTKMPLELQEQIEQLQHVPLTEKGKEIAEQIINDVANCFASDEDKETFRQVEIAKVCVGIVNTPTKGQQYSYESLFSANGSHHSRESDGVIHRLTGYVTNLGMKLTYAHCNSEKVEKLLTEDLEIIELYEEVVNIIKKKLSESSETAYTTYQERIDNLLYVEYRQQLEKIIRFKLSATPLNSASIKDATLAPSPAKISEEAEGMIEDLIQKICDELPRDGVELELELKLQRSKLAGGLRLLSEAEEEEEEEKEDHYLDGLKKQKTVTGSFSGVPLRGTMFARSALSGSEEEESSKINQSTPTKPPVMGPTVIGRNHAHSTKSNHLFGHSKDEPLNVKDKNAKGASQDSNNTYP
ncbi:FAD-dependent oxidoreductase [Legionella sp. D16C41]|uniref:FAD-dependent oxidoreductase n=1 Tax=Legionella sp. D16C41 TaxID=3402688 RepID=UPI003AF8EC65